jgi:hypothetical protein
LDLTPGEVQALSRFVDSQHAEHALAAQQGHKEGQVSGAIQPNRARLGSGSVKVGHDGVPFGQQLSCGA